MTQEEIRWPSYPQRNFIVDGAIDTHPLGTDPLVAQVGKNEPEKHKFLCS